MTKRAQELLDFWFGDLGRADLPSSDRTNLWFGEHTDLRDKILQAFQADYVAASQGKLTSWSKTSRGRLALIILLDQFPRALYTSSSKAFAHDAKALKLALDGVTQAMDHSLTLIERVFFYMPLVHAEDAEIQEKSIRLYQSLVGLSMTETTQVYQLFLAYSYAHFRVVKEYGRFPQRNELLNRVSTPDEIAFLKSAAAQS